MLRSVLAVVLGYVTMIVGSLIGIGLAWAALGGAGAFREGTTVASGAWVGFNFVFGFAAAMAGGCVAAVVGKHPRRLPVKVLAAIVLVLALALAFASMGQEPKPLPEGKTTAELGFFEAGEVASPPGWYNFVIGFVGAAGVLVGGGLRKK